MGRTRIDHKSRYMRNKSDYLKLQDNVNAITYIQNIQAGGSKKSEVKIIVGYAGFGKSYLAKEYEKDNYFVIYGDDIIQHKLIPTNENVNNFGIYHEETPKSWNKPRLNSSRF